jgi:hypothetical protein
MIIDFEEEKHVENKTIEVEEVEKLAKILVALIRGGFFDIKVDSFHIPVIVPTKAWSKCMMRHKGKEQVEEGNSPTKVT